jgi:hypothetical protein
VDRYLFFDLPIESLGITCLVLMLACSEAGFRIGVLARERVDEAMRSRITIFEGAMLGVLGLLIGFTMSMGAARFDTRRQLVVDEANAIGTTWLRSKVMPAPENAEFAGLLLQYVDARVQFTKARNLKELPQERAIAARLQDQLWSRATGFAARDPRSVPAGLLLQTSNQMIDLEATRWASFWSHIPDSVLCANVLIATLAATLLGYGFGVIGRRNMISTLMLALSISSVLTVIVDLDRPWQGYIKVSQQPMIDLQKQMKNAH